LEGHVEDIAEPEAGSYDRFQALHFIWRVADLPSGRDWQLSATGATMTVDRDWWLAACPDLGAATARVDLHESPPMRHRVMRMPSRLATIFVLVASLTLCGCDPEKNDTQVVARIKSPDGKLEAIHAYDIGGGPAVGTSDEIFIVATGTFPRLSERIFSKECVHGMGLSWSSNRKLSVTYHISSDIQDGAKMLRPSIFSLLSSGYWTFEKPHNVHVAFARILEPPGIGC
jgi:hypothetical protein